MGFNSFLFFKKRGSGRGEPGVKPTMWCFPLPAASFPDKVCGELFNSPRCSPPFSRRGAAINTRALVGHCLCRSSCRLATISRKQGLLPGAAAVSWRAPKSPAVLFLANATHVHLTAQLGHARAPSSIPKLQPCPWQCFPTRIRILQHLQRSQGKASSKPEHQSTADDASISRGTSQLKQLPSSR